MAKLSFGQHVTFRLKSEIDLVTTSNSFGIHSSGLLRSVIEGKDETIDVADLLKSNCLLASYLTIYRSIASFFNHY